MTSLAHTGKWIAQMSSTPFSDNNNAPKGIDTVFWCSLWQCAAVFSCNVYYAPRTPFVRRKVPFWTICAALWKLEQRTSPIYAEEGNAFFRSRSACSRGSCSSVRMHSLATHTSGSIPSALRDEVTSIELYNHIISHSRFRRIWFFPFGICAYHAVLFRSRPSGV